MKNNSDLIAVSKALGLASVFAITSFYSVVSYAATPIGTDFSAEQRLKLSRLASKNRQNIDLDSYIDEGSKREDAFDQNNSECGNVEIGNIERPRIGQAVQPVDVIIVGDVINVADDC